MERYTTATEKVSHVANVDCMEFMKQFPDKFFDLAVVDPPYGIDVSKMGLGKGEGKYRGNQRYSRGLSRWDIASPDVAYFNELRRVSCNQIIWGANHFISKIAIDSSCWLVWDKRNGKTDFADCEMAWTSFKKPARLFQFQWSGYLQGNMKDKELRIHPTQKPRALYAWIFENFAGGVQDIGHSFRLRIQPYRSLACRS